MSSDWFYPAWGIQLKHLDKDLSNSDSVHKPQMESCNLKMVLEPWPGHVSSLDILARLLKLAVKTTSSSSGLGLLLQKFWGFTHSYNKGTY